MSPAKNTNQHTHQNTNPSGNEGSPPMSAVQVYQALQKVARQRGRSTEEVLTLYGLERVLARLQRTSYAGDFVLKGGVLLAAYALRRPTRDADMQAVGFPLDEQHLRAVLEAIARVPQDGLDTFGGAAGGIAGDAAGDGLDIDTTSITVTAIRDEDQYGGLRARFTARLHTARLNLALDVSTGDPIHPAPQPVVLPASSPPSASPARM